MFKNRFILVLGVLSLLLVTMAVSRPLSNSSAPSVQGANDFYQRHPGWTSNDQNNIIPITGSSELSDYFLRHSGLSLSTGIAADMTDYFARHPELRATAESINNSDYFLRH